MKKIKALSVLLMLSLALTGCTILNSAMNVANKAQKVISEEETDPKSIDELAKAIKDFKKEAKSSFVTKEQLIKELESGNRGIFICSADVNSDELKEYADENNTIAFASVLGQSTVMVMPKIPGQDVMQLKLEDLAIK